MDLLIGRRRRSYLSKDRLQRGQRKEELNEDLREEERKRDLKEGLKEDLKEDLKWEGGDDLKRFSPKNSLVVVNDLLPHQNKLVAVYKEGNLPDPRVIVDPILNE